MGLTRQMITDLGYSTKTSETGEYLEFGHESDSNNESNSNSDSSSDEDENISSNKKNKWFFFF